MACSALAAAIDTCLAARTTTLSLILRQYCQFKARPATDIRLVRVTRAVVGWGGGVAVGSFASVQRRGLQMPTTIGEADEGPPKQAHGPTDTNIIE